MQISEQQKLVIRYSMLSEPGDSLGHLIFENFGPEIALRIFHPTTRKHVAEYLNTFYPEQLGNLPALIERFELRQKDIDLQATIERAIRWGAKPVFFDQLPNLSAKFMDSWPPCSISVVGGWGQLRIRERVCWGGGNPRAIGPRA
jgi:hypothetical protein